MTEEEKNRLLVETWKKAGPLLEEMKHQQLRSMTESESARIFDSLEVPVGSAYRSEERRQSLGFIEQQRFFKKLHGTHSS
ncbi:MAG: hypothetical protein AAF649_13365 [Verrucomicrobiota bacterium]